MVGERKTVLMLLDARFQAKVWRAALSSQNISVIGGLSDAHVAEIMEEIQKAQIALPDLLLTDLEIRNPYDLCRWCRRYYPKLKIVLTSNSQKNVSPIERRWAIHQGADELLAGFQSQNLLSNAIDAVGRVLKILDCPPLKEAALVPALLSCCQEAIAASDGEGRALVKLSSSETPNYLKAKNSNRSLSKGQSNSPGALANTPVSTINQTERLFWIAATFGLLSLLAIGILWQLRWRIEQPVVVTEETQESLGGQPQALSFRGRERLTEANSFEEVNAVPEGIFNHSGSTAWASILGLLESELQPVYPDLNLRYVNVWSGNPGSEVGIEMLLDGELDFTYISRPLQPEEYATAELRGFELTQHSIAIDGIAVAVNPNLSVTSLSLRQIEQIYLGRVNNWSQLGGQNLAIVPFSRSPEYSATAKFWRETILGGQDFAPSVSYVYSTTDAVRQLQDTMGGIYFASASEVVPQCTIKSLPLKLDENLSIAPYEVFITPGEEDEPPSSQCPQLRDRLNLDAFASGTYPLTRRLYLIVKRNGGREEEIGMAMVKLLRSQEGQRLIKQAGFVPVD